MDGRVLTENVVDAEPAVSGTHDPPDCCLPHVVVAVTVCVPVERQAVESVNVRVQEGVVQLADPLGTPSTAIDIAAAPHAPEAPAVTVSVVSETAALTDAPHVAWARGAKAKSTRNRQSTAAPDRHMRESLYKRSVVSGKNLI